MPKDSFFCVSFFNKNIDKPYNNHRTQYNKYKIITNHRCNAHSLD